MVKLALLTAFLVFPLLCSAQPIKVAYNPFSTQIRAFEERLADAIYVAEGGANTKHPYGVLKHYVRTTPRTACINTIRHAARDWKGQGDFIAFLGARYSPLGAANDPQHLNRNWIHNVQKLMK